MTNAQKLTLELIRYEFSGTPLSDSLDTSAGALCEVYEIAVSQGVASIVGEALSGLGLLVGDIKQAFFSEQLANMYIIEQIKYELSRVCRLFEDEKISFIPLKGSVLRDYYPKPEMRESCDIDILIHKEDLKRACTVLNDKLRYEKRVSSPHDVGLFSQSGIELELHHSLYSADDNKKRILDRVWDYAAPCIGYENKHELCKEFFILYHLVHMVKHIRNGGCGIRPFLDLYIIENKIDYDRSILHKLLQKAGITDFADVAIKASKVWFGKEETDQTIELLADYIFSAGVYGNLDNQMAASLARNGSKFKNLMDRIFMPYDKLKVIYPILNEHPVLTPWYEVRRWHRIIFKDKAQTQLAMIKYNAAITDERKKNITTLMENLGLK